MKFEKYQWKRIDEIAVFLDKHREWNIHPPIKYV